MVIIIGWLVIQDISCKVETSTWLHAFVHLRLLKCSPIRELSRLQVYEEVKVNESVTLWHFVIWIWLMKVVCDQNCGDIESMMPPKVNGVALWCVYLFEPTSYILMSSIKVLWDLMYLIKLFLHQTLHMHNIYMNSTYSNSHLTMTILGMLSYLIYLPF